MRHWGQSGLSPPSVKVPSQSIGWSRLASRLSPFHYFEPMALLAETPLSGGNVGVLLTVAAAGVAAGYAIFARRDL